MVWRICVYPAKGEGAVSKNGLGPLVGNGAGIMDTCTLLPILH